MIDLMNEYKSDVQVHQLDHQYVLSSNDEAKELVIVGTN
jgi:hypothetical protein